VFLSEAYSVSPSLLLALAETEHGVLSGDDVQDEEAFRSWLRWTALSLSRWFYDAYYGRALPLTSPLQQAPLKAQAGNAATYALRSYYLSRLYGGGDPAQGLAAWEAQLGRTYERYFGPLDAGKLQLSQPDATAWALLPSLLLPWRGGENWYFTGGPHNMDGSDRYPRSGVDFQPVGHPGCEPPFVPHRWATASAAGRAIDYQSHWVKLDHDNDGEAMTGWQTVYGHLANRVADGVQVHQGEPLGNPSCYGGFAGGVHVHFGVKYENVWQPVEAVVLSGWRFQNGLEGYEGWMVREGLEDRISCVQPDRPNMDCAHAALRSDNWGETVRRFR
jgi:murein DD-endopeptidase MepM/ murein hydrolase activator NlpD